MLKHYTFILNVYFKCLLHLHISKYIGGTHESYKYVETNDYYF